MKVKRKQTQTNKVYWDKHNIKNTIYTRKEEKEMRLSITEEEQLGEANKIKSINGNQYSKVNTVRSIQ